LVDIAFLVFNNHNLEEEVREQRKERRQAKLMAAAIGVAPIPQRHPQTKRPESFKCKSWGTRQGIAQSHPQDPVMNALK
jgi:hypothetical protein